MKGYVLDYIDEKEFKKLERVLKKYNMLAFKKLNFEYYPALRNGKFLGDLIFENGESKTYELKLPSDKMFAQTFGEAKLIYIVYKKKETIMLDKITSLDILLERHKSELTTYKGIMISKENPSKDIFKIDLLNMLQDCESKTTKKPRAKKEKKFISIDFDKKNIIISDKKLAEKLKRNQEKGKYIFENIDIDSFKIICKNDL